MAILMQIYYRILFVMMNVIIYQTKNNMSQVFCLYNHCKAQNDTNSMISVTSQNEVSYGIEHNMTNMGETKGYLDRANG